MTQQIVITRSVITQSRVPSRRSLLVRSISRPAVVGIVAGAVAAAVVPSPRAA